MNAQVEMFPTTLVEEIPKQNRSILAEQKAMELLEADTPAHEIAERMALFGFNGREALTALAVAAEKRVLFSRIGALKRKIGGRQ